MYREALVGDPQVVHLQAGEVVTAQGGFPADQQQRGVADVGQGARRGRGWPGRWRGRRGGRWRGGPWRPRRRGGGCRPWCVELHRSRQRWVSRRSGGPPRSRSGNPRSSRAEGRRGRGPARRPPRGAGRPEWPGASPGPGRPGTGPRSAPRPAAGLPHLREPGLEPAPLTVVGRPRRPGPRAAGVRVRLFGQQAVATRDLRHRRTSWSTVVAVGRRGVNRGRTFAHGTGAGAAGGPNAMAASRSRSLRAFCASTVSSSSPSVRSRWPNAEPGRDPYRRGQPLTRLTRLAGFGEPQAPAAPPS